MLHLILFLDSISPAARNTLKNNCLSALVRLASYASSSNLLRGGGRLRDEPKARLRIGGYGEVCLKQGLT